MSIESPPVIIGVVNNTHGAESRRPHTHINVALNLPRLIAGQLRSVGEALGVPMSGSISDLWLLFKGKITDLGRDSRNVSLSKDKDDKMLTLSDYEGVFLTVTPVSEKESTDSTELRDREASQSPEPVEANELEAVCTERDEP